MLSPHPTEKEDEPEDLDKSKSSHEQLQILDQNVCDEENIYAEPSTCTNQHDNTCMKDSDGAGNEYRVLEGPSKKVRARHTLSHY